MPEAVSIDYRLGQNGWSELQLTVGEHSIAMGPFGYCTDALGDLVRAALIIATSGFQSEVSFDGEPRKWRLLIGVHWDAAPERWTDFRLRVIDGETKVFEAQCSSDAFVEAVLNAAQSIWDEYGADGYDKAWRGQKGFPLRALRALREAVSISEPRASAFFGPN